MKELNQRLVRRVQDYCISSKQGQCEFRSPNMARVALNGGDFVNGRWSPNRLGVASCSPGRPVGLDARTNGNVGQLPKVDPAVDFSEVVPEVSAFAGMT